MLPLTGKTAVITGSARNIGRAIALMLAADGADILVHAKQDSSAAEAVADEVRAIGGKAAVCLADLSTEEAAEGLAQSAIEAFGRIDIVVLNAAIRRQNPFLEIDFAEWREVLAVDLDGPFLCMKACLPHMLATGDGGRIITISGTTPHLAKPNRAHVAAAKMGLLGLTRTIATEFGKHGITANCVAPGHIDTVRGESAGVRSDSGAGRPIQRFGSADEIAAMVRHLCRPESAYTTGQCLHVNGGMFYAGG